MKQKEIDKLLEPLREEKMTHLAFVRSQKGISFSSFATGDDIYEFLQVMADTNPTVLEIYQAVVESRKNKAKKVSLPVN